MKEVKQTSKEPQIFDRRFAVCKYTKKMVEQSYDGQDWVCLHDDDEEER